VRPFAALFPGQGAQHPGMGAALAAACDPAAAAFREADRALETDLSEMCFGGTEEELARTEITQPAILATSIAAFRAFRDRGGAMPSAVAGHSLGEYSAHVVAGTLDFGDALRCVRQRGRFMQEAVPEGTGAMAAILGLDREAVARACEAGAQGEVVACANFNGPGQVVIAGHAGAVARASEAALAAGAKRAVPLQVSAPFHCALMEPAAARLAPVLDAVPFHDPTVPVYTNVDAAPVATGASAKDALVRQVASAVRWDDLIVRMAEDGASTFIEFGPGKVLAGLVRRLRKDARVLSVGDPVGVDAALAELAA
jgi:[acyl-carrier-protein] S-malonyltransferase